MESKPLVLIIDDSSINILLLCNLLEEQSYRVVSTNNGEDGLALAKQYSPDLILLDIAMPGWDGYHTCQCLKQDRAMEKIPILFLSVLDDAKNKVRALQVGGVDYISKPFEKEELLARVKTHIELAHLRQHLEDEVANKTKKNRTLLKALQFSYDKAQQASILKTEFLHNLSHEFRTPMNIILGMTEILIEDTELTEEQHQLASAVINASRQLMDELINMLNFAEHFKGEIKQVICDFKVGKIVNNILNQFAANAQSKDLQISADIAPALRNISLRGNQEGIDNILSNLIDNAIKFTKQGEIVIRVQSLEADDKKLWIRFEVNDTGIGIAEEKKVHLFKIFSQIDGSSTRAYEGMGMGLAVAKMFADKMGGQIGVNSILDRGSTFWFNVPLTNSF